MSDRTLNYLSINIQTFEVCKFNNMREVNFRNLTTYTHFFDDFRELHLRIFKQKEDNIFKYYNKFLNFLRIQKRREHKITKSTQVAD